MRFWTAFWTTYMPVSWPLKATFLHSNHFEHNSTQEEHKSIFEGTCWEAAQQPLLLLMTQCCGIQAGGLTPERRKKNDFWVSCDGVGGYSNNANDFKQLNHRHLLMMVLLRKAFSHKWSRWHPIANTFVRFWSPKWRHFNDHLKVSELW